MLNINFVPDEYIKSNESRRTNLMYLVLFAVVMAVLGGSFMTIKIRQRALSAKENLVNEKMTQANEALEQFEKLQAKRKVMIKTALTTTELLEPVPRSVLLASLTNNLPPSVSLLRLKIVQKELKRTNHVVPTNKYRQAQAKKTTAAQPKVSQEKLLETYIDIEGIAPSDLQVAAYIEQLGNSTLLDNVALVESKEYKIRGRPKTQPSAFGAPDTTYRQFKLTAILRKDIHLTSKDVSRIRTRCDKVVSSF